MTSLTLRKLVTWTAPPLVLALIAACGDDTQDGPPGGASADGTGGTGGRGAGVPMDGGGGSGGVGAAGGNGGSGPLEITFDWYACPYAPGQNGECVKAQVPLDWSDPNGEKIPFFVKRIPAAVQPARGQLWILQGGPGASGTTIEFMAQGFAAVAGDLDMYVPDHRGTGFSAELSCPEIDYLPGTSRPVDPADVEALLPDCVADLQAEWGEGLGSFSSTEAGRDVGEVIERTREPGQEVYVYGVSYGTRWAHRYLQQFPAQASGVIFDSIVGEPSAWLDFDIGIDGVAQSMFAACGADAYCSSKLGADPWLFVQDLMTKLDAGHCPTSLELGKADYKAMLATLMVGGFSTRARIPALAYRIDRCDPIDQTVIENLYAAFESVPEHFSGALHYNVVGSELIEVPVASQADLAIEEDTLLVSSVQMQGYRAAYDLWPRYAAGDYNGAFAQTDVPILMMNSPLDAQTTIGPANEFASHYSGTHQTYVVVERSSHAVTGGAPLGNGTTCGMVLSAQFLTDPEATLDTSCKDQVLPINFQQSGSSFGAGTLNIWDNIMTLAGPAPAGQEPVNVIDQMRSERRIRIGGVR